ncbi:MAG: hypothetical protein Q8R49_05065 [Rhodoferax sp.]|nr:hypothetical protein [Rhodoferax sp.]
MSEHYDALETRDHSAREAALLAALPGQIAHARTSSLAFGQILENVNPAQVTSRQALASVKIHPTHWHGGGRCLIGKQHV